MNHAGNEMGLRICDLPPIDFGILIFTLICECDLFLLNFFGVIMEFQTFEGVFRK